MSVVGIGSSVITGMARTANIARKHGRLLERMGPAVAKPVESTLTGPVRASIARAKHAKLAAFIAVA